MVSSIGCLTTLDDSENVETWIRCFEALARVKKLRETKRRGAKWNYGHVPRNISVRSNPESFNDGLPKKSRRADFQRNWRGNKKEYQTKEKISHRWKNEVSGNKTAPRRVVHRLEERARYCEFERLGTDEMTTGELIMLCLLEGMHDQAFKQVLI